MFRLSLIVFVVYLSALVWPATFVQGESETRTSNGYVHCLAGTNDSAIQIRARGDEGGERLQLLVDEVVVASYVTTTSNQIFTYIAGRNITADRVRVAFTNDVYDPDAGIDANLVVDYVRIDGTTYETEASTTFSTGTWLPADGIAPGFRQSETLHANGYFQYLASSSKPKNVVFIMLDDADFSDFGFNNSFVEHPDAVTPFMNSMRRKGRLFSNFYAASSICSPTRMSVLTGCNPVQFGGIDAWPTGDVNYQHSSGMNGLPNTVPQLGTTMKALGMSTGFFGKWHVGWARQRYQPPALGFDRHTKILGTSGNHGWDGTFRFYRETGQSREDVDFLDARLADDAVDFIDDCVDQGKEFFLDYCPFSPHSPWVAPRSYTGNEFDLSTIRGNTLALMKSVDAEIGRIVAKLRDRGVLNDTLILITSDNGGQAQAQHLDNYLSGFKGNLLEGGIRVPLIAYWPGVIAPNSTNRSVLTTYDLLPTLMELRGGDPTSIYSMVDGRSFAGLMFDDAVIPHEPIYWEISGNPMRTRNIEAQRSKAIRSGDYKLVKLEGRDEHTDPTAWRMFNLRTDPMEKQNLSYSQPGRVAELRLEMERARERTSRLKRVPEMTFNEFVISADPRMDVASKDMTLTMSLTVPANRDGDKSIYSKPGTQHLTLDQDGRLLWRITGADIAGNPVNYWLKGRRILRPTQTYEIKMIIGGFKRDIPTVQLYINGRLMDDLDWQAPDIITIWSASNSDAIFGDEGILLSGIEYHSLRFWPKE